MLQDFLKDEAVADMRDELTEPIFEALQNITKLDLPEYFGSKKELSKYLHCDISFINRVLTPLGLPSIPLTGKKIMYKRSKVDEFLLQYQVNGDDYVPRKMPRRVK